MKELMSDLAQNLGMAAGVGEGLKWKYDVFLSFRGEDTRNNFTAHLYVALVQKGINTYKDDDKLKEELAMTIGCRKTKQQEVLPVFYDVNPTEVRYQRESFRKSLARLKARLKDETKVQRWKATLTEVVGLSEFTLGDRNKFEFIQKVVLEVSRSVNCKYLMTNVSKHLVGMQSRVQDIHNKLLSMEVNDTTCILGIFGIGGAGKHEEYVTNIHNGCGFFPHAGIQILKEKSLITIDEYGSVNMHDLLKVMGKEIVHKETEESTKDPGKCSRLWFHEDVHFVLENNMGTNKIEGILIDLPKKKDLIHLSPEACWKMEKLRVLINRNAFFSEPPSYFSNELRVLDFKNHHGTSFSSNFNGEKLVALRMASCLISKELGNKFKNFQKLKFMDFAVCKFLTRIPGMLALSNLEQFRIYFSKRLVEVHQSIGSLSKLVKLSISFCNKLKSLPSFLNLRSLKELTLMACGSVVSFPVIGLEMKHLTSIKCSYTGIKELTSSIGNLTELQELDLAANKNLAHIPSSILQLEHLSPISMAIEKLLRIQRYWRGRKDDIRPHHLQWIQAFQMMDTLPQ
ncbi:disease resistance protein RUN1-like [Carya illinoinensis]|uniref:disease resistance protein RUN1-like n=1 Tax=Carya illinoinensis TaxID=32201 RepID=UPI001C72091A|nr:disease resistance protein RUN1-like [Carya illinoinensis]